MIGVIPGVIKNFFLLFLDLQFLMLMGVVVVLIALQYRRSESIRAGMFGVKTGRMWRDTAIATAFGLAGGLAGSIAGVLAGIPLANSGAAFLFLLLLSVVLMMFNPRFLCFAYAGGIISLVHIVTGRPDVNIYQILALVALLHLVESLMIFFSGHLGAVPSFFMDGSGRVVGGFVLQKFWPIPLVVLTVAGYISPSEVSGGMPGWWPLIKPGTDQPDSLIVYAMAVVVAGLGYSDLAISRNPWRKSRLSALLLAVYSIVLLLLSAFAQHVVVLAPAAALFAPLGHELVIYIGKKIELAGRPVFTPSDRGVRILDVVPNSQAWHMGIRSGDIIISVNGIPVHNRHELRHIFESGRTHLEIEFLKGAKSVYRRGVAYRPDTHKSIGILPVPAANEESYMEISPPGCLMQKLAAWLKKNKR